MDTMLTQQIVNGVMLGAIYVLIAVAFTLAIGVLNFLNFSIPGLFMVGGVGTWILLRYGVHWSLAIGGALLIAALVSLSVERLSYRRSGGSNSEVPLVSSLGFLVVLENAALVLVGSDQQAFPAVMPDFNIRVGSLVIGGAQIVSLVVVIGMVSWLSIFLQKSKTGRQVRAVAENRETAILLGVNVNKLVPRIFVFTALFTALAGVLFASTYLQVNPFMGQGIGFKGLAAMIIGGMGSIWGAVIGGLLIGLTEVLSVSFIGADFANIAVYGLLLVLLIVRPNGLLGHAAVREKL